MTPEQEQKFKFRLRFEKEQAAVADPVEEGRTLAHSPRAAVLDVGRELVKGASGVVDFMTGLVGTTSEAAADLTPEQRAAMSPQDWANLPMTRAIPAIDAGAEEGDIFYRGNQYGEKGEGLMTAANLTGAALVPFGKVKNLKQAKDLVSSAIKFGGAAGLYDAYTEDTGDVGKVVAGLSGLTVPAIAKNLIKKGNVLGMSSKLDDAVAAIHNISKDPKSMLIKAKAAIARKERGTLGQLTADDYILSLEKGASKTDEFNRGLDAINESIVKGAVDDLTGVAPTGARPESVLKLAKDRVDKTAASIAARTETKKAALIKSVAKQEEALVKEVAKQENVLTKAVAQQTAKASDDITTFNLKTLNEANPSTTPIATVGAEGQTALSNNITAAYNKAWGEVDNIPVQSWLNFKQAAKGVKNLADEADKVTIKNLVKMMDEVKGKPTATKIKAFDTALRNAASSAETKSPALYAVIKDMRTGMRDGLEGGAAAKLKEIDSYFPKYLTVRKAGAAADGVYTPEQLNQASKVVAQEKRFAQGEGFMEATTKPELGKVKYTADTTKALEDAAKASIKREEAVVGKGIKETQARAKALRATKIKRTEAIKEKSYAGQFAKHDDAVDAVNKVLGNTTNAASQTRELIRMARKDPAGKGIQSLKAAYVEALTRKVTKGGEIATTAADKFKSLKVPLKELFDSAEMNRIAQAIKESGKIKMHSGIDITHLPEAGKGLKFYAASIFGIKAANAILSGNSLLIGRLGREAAIGKFVVKPHVKMLKLMEEMMLDPKKYVEGIERIKAAPTQTNIKRALVEWGVRATIADSELEKDNGT